MYFLTHDFLFVPSLAYWREPSSIVMWLVPF
jgi:hypothetical protein